MKQIFCVAFAAVAAMFAGCSKNETSMPESTAGAPEVRITLQNESSTRGVSGDDNVAASGMFGGKNTSASGFLEGKNLSTRAFFDDSAVGEEWENKITKLTIHVYSPQGALVMRRRMTAEELNAKSARFALPRSMKGQNCTFFVVANADYPDVATLTDIEKGHRNEPLMEYNELTGHSISQKRKDDGLVMEGVANTIIAESGATTVAVTLRRTVAKLAIRTTIDPSFESLNGGKIVVKSITISGAETCFYYGGQALFYLRESAANTPATLIISGTYYPASGAPSIDTEHRIVLKGSGDGSIKRNGYYRVDAVIKGFTEGDLNVNFTIANWEIPITQNVNFGK